MTTLRMRPAFDTLLRDSLAEVRDAEAIEAAEATQAQDGVERLRLQAAHLVSALDGGPWPTGAAVRFAPEQEVAPAGATTLDIRFPAPHAAQPVPASPLPGDPPRQGRRVPSAGAPGE